MYCKNCGTQMSDNQKFCDKCGTCAEEKIAFCSNCGTQLNPNADVCLNCGVAVKKEVKTGNMKDEDKIGLMLICFFIGFLGVHNFMLGETKKGVFKILINIICGLGELFAIIDLIKIGTDTYVVDPDKLI